MTLQEYVSSGAGSDSDLAAKIGLSETSVYRIRTGRQAPPLETMRRIAVATGNKVTPNDFAGIKR